MCDGVYIPQVGLATKQRMQNLPASANRQPYRSWENKRAEKQKGWFQGPVLEPSGVGMPHIPNISPLPTPQRLKNWKGFQTPEDLLTPPSIRGKPHSPAGLKLTSSIALNRTSLETQERGIN